MATEQEHGAIVWKERQPGPVDRKATIHVDVSRSNYGSSVFEGIRCYDTKRGSGDIQASTRTSSACSIRAPLYRSRVPFTTMRSLDACRQLVLANEYKACYLRPIHHSGLRDLRSRSLSLPHRHLHLHLAVGQVPWSRSARAGRRRVCLELDPHCAKHVAFDGEGRRELHELAAHQDGSEGQRLRRGNRARPGRLHQRGLG